MQVERHETTFWTYNQKRLEFSHRPFFQYHLAQTIPIPSTTYTKVLGGLEDIVADEQVIAKEIKLVLHVLEETTDKSGQVNDMGRLVLFKDSLSILWLSARA
jgi:hypothetical protein